ncbi:DUF192 domain-containing protein [uncultured Methanobrevibacter sp.]|uniref:DUF192 domain-containing protein n=1 Tax=uncultured Methanobrevibacter sp. TaxID=253161 RepID=UPI0025D40070|nr:DUF192 domain-containing protein [uncultured Methanobrevibacter sp.]
MRKLKNYNLLVKLILKCKKVFKNKNIYKYQKYIENKIVMDIKLKNRKNKKNKNLYSLHIKKSNEKIVEIKIANDYFSRLMGLMFRKNAKNPLLLEIPNKLSKKERSSIHSFFMRFEIVIVFIDKNNIVYEIADLKPWNYYVPKRPAKYIVEFDKKEFDDCLKIGDEIEIK